MPQNRLAHRLAVFRRSLVAVGVFSLVINALALTVPLHMMQVYDRVLSSHSGATLFFLSTLAAFLLAIFGLLELVRSRVLLRLGTGFDDLFGERLFAAAIADRLHGSGDPPGQGLRDLETVRSFLSGGSLPLLFDAPLCPLFIAAVFLLHPVLGLVALAGALLLLAIAILNETITRAPLREAARESMAATAFAEASLRNADAIEAMGMRAALVRRWQARHRTALIRQSVAADRGTWLSSGAKFVRPLLQVAMLSAGAALAIEQVITPGLMIAASIIMGRALAPVEGAITMWRGFVGARAAYARLRNVLGRHPDRSPPMALPAPAGALEVNGVFASPPRTVKPVLRGVSFALAPGEALGIIGPSAAGKSTLARVLVGVWPVLAGEIRLDGAALADWDRSELGRHVGYVPQDIELFDGTVAENIARCDEPDSHKVIAAARLARVHEMILRLQRGYETTLGEGGAALSAGQRQRIALARALYGDPALVVLDEPNSNLDGDGEDALRAAILGLKAAGKTVVIIAHRPNVVGVVDKILMLRDGATELFGPRAEVLARVTRPLAEIQPAALRK